MQDLVSIAKWMFEKMQGVHDTIYNDISQFKTQMSQLKPEDLANVGYFFREIANFADAIEKEARLASEAAGKFIGLIAVETGEMTVKAKYATADVDVRFMFDIPGQSDPRFATFQKILGLPTHDCLKVDWKKAQDKLNSIVELGGKIPEDSLKRRPEFKVRYTRRKRQD